MTLLGIDVSHHQRGINLGALDVDFIIMKASEGVGYKDDLLDTFYAQARNAGKLTGLYHYARNASPANTAKEEAASFVNIVKKWIGESILILDWEDGNGVGNVTWAKEWLDEVTRLTGVRPLLYTSRSVANSYNWSGVLKDYGLWLAAYPGGLNSLKEYDYSKYNTLSAPWTVVLWQYTSSGRISGYSGNLDLNVAYMNADGWRKCATGERPDSYKEIREAAVAKARSYVGQYQFSGQCERFVRTCYGFGPLYKSANHAWRNAEGRHPGDMNPPAGVPVFWDLIGGVNDPYDHIAISIGGGEVITTSSRGSGTEIGIVSIASYTDAQAKYRGWAEVYHGVRIYPARDSETVDPQPNPDPEPAPTDNPVTGISVATCQRQLKEAGYYTGLIDGVVGQMTRAAILAYQNGQKYFPNMLRDGIWGPLTQAHYMWVKSLQTAVNQWKTASRMGKTLVDGDYGNYAAQLVRQTIADNFSGTYANAVHAVYGSGVVPVNDGQPGRAFCHMIGISVHPAL